STLLHALLIVLCGGGADTRVRPYATGCRPFYACCGLRCVVVGRTRGFARTGQGADPFLRAADYAVWGGRAAM
ncbi:MAG: hypothetical protein JXA25_17725, partial [Anaerolineales bacterium]|nr:hypothetical protein [Anaerolineales bacterium]